MEEILYERRFPGSATAILVGGLPPPSVLNPAGLRALLWLGTAGDFAGLGSAPPPPWSLLDIALATAGQIETAIEEVVRRDARRVPSIFVTASTLREQVGRYQAAVGQIYAAVEGHLRARDTRQKDGLVWQRHVLGNVPAYLNRRIPAGWERALAGLPAFVCGAGPSLDASASALARVADRGVIFSADSALRALARVGVTADFAVSIDAAKVPEKCLPPEGPPLRVVFCSTSPSSWAHRVPESAQFLVSSRQVTVDWLEELGVGRTGVRATESCGSTALELAHYLGCAPIYLFGMDLAMDPRQPTTRHSASADPALYAASGFDAARNLPRVAGNYGEVATHIFGDLRALKQRLVQWPVGLVYNVNDRGARLDNAILVHPTVLAVGSAEPKALRLAGLPPAEAATPAARAAITAAFAAVAARGMTALPALRRQLAAGGPAAVVPGFRALFTDKDFSRGLGAFSMKCLPHLMPPVEGDAAFWLGLLDELESLLAALGIVAVGL